MNPGAQVRPEEGASSVVHPHERRRADPSGFLQCPGCGRYTHTVQADGRCLDCNLGWVHCHEHVRLEWACSDHQRVRAAQIVAAFRDRQAGGTGGR